MKKILALILALVMCLSLVACGNSEVPTGGDEADTARVLKVAFTGALTNPEAQTLQKLSDDLLTATGGRYKLEILADHTDAEALQQVKSGVVNMAVVANTEIEALLPDFAVLTAPYVFSNEDHMLKLLQSGDLDSLYETTAEEGFTILATYCLGARGIYSSRAYAAPADLAGRMIRVANGESCIDTLLAMGGIGQPMVQDAVRSALETGLMDGADGDLITYMNSGMYEAANQFSKTNHQFMPDQLIIGNATLDNMAPADQEALKKLCTESVASCFQLCAETRKQYTQQAAELGVVFTECDILSYQTNCQELTVNIAERSDTTKAVYSAALALR